MCGKLTKWFSIKFKQHKLDVYNTHTVNKLYKKNFILRISIVNVTKYK